VILLRDSLRGVEVVFEEIRVVLPKFLIELSLSIKYIKEYVGFLVVGIFDGVVNGRS